MNRRYVLEGRTPVQCPDLLTWAHWFETADRCVKLTIQGDVSISTAFLGVDHRFTPEGPPILFETMVFIDRHGDDLERYATWEEAEAGHDRWVMKIFKPTPILELPRGHSDGS